VKTIETPLAGLVVIEPKVFKDERGFVLETFQIGRYREAGIADAFVQDNLSHSVEGTLRGLHFQEPHGQGKLVQVIRGAVFDVAVDIRRGSPTFGRWFGETLTAENKLQLYVPVGFAHGFCVLEDGTEVLYKCGDYYSGPADQRGVLWNDPGLAISWPCENPLVSDKDRTLLPLRSDREDLPDLAAKASAPPG
jgi:dTDP-4-dehydrorhamnose 3,5-epimerase